MASASDIYSAVSSHYSAASNGRTANGTYETTVAKAFGYSLEELASIPQDANLGLSCGNPLVLAALRPGETVVDLGCGAGFDVFLAAPNVGPSGQAIGVDMNKDMLAKAEKNRNTSGATNVKFVEAPITNIAPLGDSTVDCIISNCVVNLVPEEEKSTVFREMYRLLKPKGRVAISDILIKDGCDLPANLKNDMALLVGCIAGASYVSGYEKYLKDAGFNNVLILDNRKDLNVYNTDTTDSGQGSSCCGTGVTTSNPKSCCGTSNDQKQTNGMAVVGFDPKDVDFNAYAGSYNIYAVKG